ncbi:MAG: PmoA family protein [Candidatus Solibacter usitatus]|nr:PmoA family protein [Candidatus Solibacter usitatus]
MLLPTILLPLLALCLPAQVKIQKDHDKISIEIDGKPFSDLYLSGEGVRKAFLHPLRSASGKIVTRSYPMAQVAGETNDHPHHTGLWFNHGDVNGIDFWGSSPKGRNDKGATIVTKNVSKAVGGKTGVIVADFEWQEKSGNVVLKEARTMMFSGGKDTRTIDFDIKLTAVQTAKFGDTKEGSFALRLNDTIKEQKGTGKMVNAEGAAGEKAVWGKPSPWVDYSGTLDGEQLGIAILDHPTNPGHPTHWHSRSYGLFAANIFGLRDFYNDKSKDGSRTLQAGESMRFRYRVIVHTGDAASAGIAGEFKKYAAMK